MSRLLLGSLADPKNGLLMALADWGGAEEVEEARESQPPVIVTLLITPGYPVGVGVCPRACAVPPTVPLSVLSATTVCSISSTTNLLGPGLAAVHGPARVRSVTPSPTVSVMQLSHSLLHSHRSVLHVLLQEPRALT
jgi:hypothetical protein